MESAVRPEFELKARGLRVPLGPVTLVMGVVNVTPDSFSDGGRYQTPERAVEHARRLLAEGADIIDIGGESSRPGAVPISADQETDRVLPVIEQLLQKEPKALLSIDTCKAAVAREALFAGAHLVNDVSALGDDAMAGVIASTGAAAVLMHMRGRPQTMQLAPPSPDIRGEIRRDLQAAVDRAVSAGVDPSSLLLDPGIGFGKTFDDNLAILADLGFLRELGLPIVVGTSRKSFLGALVDSPPAARLIPTVASSVAALLEGAHVIRVHDVAAAREAASVADAILAARSQPALRTVES